ncbi:MAG: hypothetical protein HC901_02805 [Bdellovibrionaceae bacterium]|nr:hypothetical protein [Pseudobdellovibrionaceae bacterium]
MVPMVFAGSGLRASEPGYSDPATPAERPAFETTEAANPSVWELSDAIRNAQRRIEQLENALSALPAIRDNRPAEALGFHSEYLAIEDIDPERREPVWTLEGRFRERRNEDHFLVLVPAVDNRLMGENKSYGFPTRFSIDMLVGEKFVTIVDWREVDFPAPNLHPVIFRLPRTQNYVVRLKVYQGVQEDEIEYFALAKIMSISATGILQQVRPESGRAGYEYPPTEPTLSDGPALWTGSSGVWPPRE